MNYVKGDVCGQDNCRSTQYYIEDGQYYCRAYGHLKEGRLVVHEDEDDYQPGGFRRKTRSKKEENEKILYRFQGQQAYELFLECHQLILWKQVYWLIQKKSFPAELEVIVHDLWSLRLQVLKTKLLKLSAKDSQDFHLSTQQTTDSNLEEDGRTGSADRSLYCSPRLLDTISLCYIGILMLRLPLSLGTLHRWIEDEDFPYIRAIRFLPKEMKSRLPMKYFNSFESRTVLKHGELHHRIRSLINLYTERFKMEFPPLNHPMFLLQYIKDLALPINLYPAVQNLVSILKFDFKFPTTFLRVQISRYPEIKLISLVIICVKLSQGFEMPDSRLNTNQSSKDLAINWEKWQQAQSEFCRDGSKEKGLKPSEAIQSKEENVFEMNDRQLDEYMDWYDSMWIKDQVGDHVSEHLLRLFPISGPEVDPRHLTKAKSKGKEVQSKPESSLELERLHTVLSALEIQKKSSDDQSRQRGPESHYRFYRAVEDLPPAAFSFCKVAAKMIGCTLPQLVTAVFQIEMVIQKGGKSVTDVDTGSDISVEPSETDTSSIGSSIESNS